MFTHARTADAASGHAISRYRRHLGILLAVWSCSGCAQILGLDNFTDQKDNTSKGGNGGTGGEAGAPADQACALGVSYGGSTSQTDNRVEPPLSLEQHQRPVIRDASSDAGTSDSGR